MKPGITTQSEFERLWAIRDLYRATLDQVHALLEAGQEALAQRLIERTLVRVQQMEGA